MSGSPAGFGVPGRTGARGGGRRPGSQEFQPLIVRAADHAAPLLSVPVMVPPETRPV